MKEITKKVLVLGFETATGKTINLTINKPKEGMEGTEVFKAMESIVAAKALGEDALINSSISAKYVTQEEDALSLN